MIAKLLLLIIVLQRHQLILWFSADLLNIMAECDTRSIQLVNIIFECVVPRNNDSEGNYCNFVIPKKHTRF